MSLDISLITFAIAVAGLTLIPGATTMLVIRRATPPGADKTSACLIRAHS